LPFDTAILAAAPLGWVAAAEPWHIAPRFPLGLPLVMAVFRAVAGRSGPFLVAPVLGVLAVVLAYVIVRRRSQPATAVVAAALVACSPTFVLMAIQPMSDVPATFWLLVAAAAAWAPAPRPLVWALAGGMAMFTRPLLLLPVLVIGGTASWPRRRDVVAAVAIVAALAAAFLAIQWHFYGRPFSTGYGTADVLFTPSVVPRNLFRHAAWLLRTHTPLVPIAFIAGAYRDRPLALRAGLIFAAVALPYVFYVNDIDDWEMTRFLLPGWAFILMACAPGLVWTAAANTVRTAIVTTAIVVLAVAGSLFFLTKADVFNMWVQELKYPMVASRVGTGIPREAVVMASLHSGSLKHYTDRNILRLEKIPPPALAPSVRAIETAGFPVYAVVEQGDELEQLTSALGASSGAPIEAVPLTTIRGTYVLRLSAPR
jgi:hypothetical protein